VKITFAFCTYDRAHRLKTLVAAMRAQQCPVPYEILAINNNSRDGTAELLASLAVQPGPPMRWVNEAQQGIVPARNRAIEESLRNDILVFIDDDELPQPGLLNAVYDAIANEGAQCVGGRVEVDFGAHGRPSWLEDDLLAFLAETNYGASSFWIDSDKTPIWTSNVAYDLKLFRDDPALRFDNRYNREGHVFGGGEDVVMFRRLLELRTRMRYRPDMVVLHQVEPWRLHRLYFLRLHHQAGERKGLHEWPDYPRQVLGIPPFLIAQALRHSIKAIPLLALNKPGALRQAMNAAHAFGLIKGKFRRYRSRGIPP